MQDRNMRSQRFAFETLADLEPRHIRKVYVEGDEVRIVRGHGNRFLTVSRFYDFITRFTKRAPERVTQSLIVIHGKYFNGGVFNRGRHGTFSAFQASRMLQIRHVAPQWPAW